MGWGTTDRAFSCPTGSVWPKISGRRGRPLIKHSSCQKTRMNDLSCRIKMLAQTDRRTETSWQYRALHYMQSHSKIINNDGITKCCGCSKGGPVSTVFSNLGLCTMLELIVKFMSFLSKTQVSLFSRQNEINIRNMSKYNHSNIGDFACVTVQIVQL